MTDERAERDLRALPWWKRARIYGGGVATTERWLQERAQYLADHPITPTIYRAWGSHIQRFERGHGGAMDHAALFDVLSRLVADLETNSENGAPDYAYDALQHHAAHHGHDDSLKRADDAATFVVSPLADSMLERHFEWQLYGDRGEIADNPLSILDDVPKLIREYGAALGWPRKGGA
jgi:hypothetical protein